MSLQDDYFDLAASLKGSELKAFKRIWSAFITMEAKEMLRTGMLTQEQYDQWNKEST